MVEQVRQLTLDLPVRKTYAREDFFVSPCNKEAVDWVDLYPNWPAHAIMIFGPKGCGKTHLAHVFAAEVIEAAEVNEDFIPKGDKIVIENVDEGVDEQALFHFFNRTKERGIGVLMTAQRAPIFRLADLASRMALVPKVPIEAPDDELMYGVLACGFGDRGIAVEPAVLEYAIKRIERSFQAIQQFIEEADVASLAAGRAITIPMLRLILDTKNGCILPVDAL